jgi:glycosyltransferase involved in cell wall biosynthesis
MRVIYSIGAKFAGGGIGTTAYHAVQGLYRHAVLHRLLCGSFRPTEIPREKIKTLGLPSRVLRRLALYDRTGWVMYVHNVLFDFWASRLLEATRVFHVWSGHGLCSLQHAKSFGALTIVERASAHPSFQRDILCEEFARWGMKFRWLQRSFTRALEGIKLTDYVIVPSTFAKDSFTREGVSASRIMKIALGLDTAKFQPRMNHGSRETFRVSYVGQLSLQKGVMYLLEAWEKLRWTDAELWLVGRIESEIRALLKRYTLQRVRIFGYVPNVKPIYQQSDVFVFPSLHDGFGLVVLEAMACGLPVITTHNTAGPDIITEGESGFVVPIRDVDTLAERMERLRSDERLRREMGKAARARAEEFTWERYGDALAEAYRQCVVTGEGAW